MSEVVDVAFNLEPPPPPAACAFLSSPAQESAGGTPATKDSGCTHLLRHMCLPNLASMGGSVVLSKIETDGDTVGWSAVDKLLARSSKTLGSVNLNFQLSGIIQGTVLGGMHHTTTTAFSVVKSSPLLLSPWRTATRFPSQALTLVVPRP